MADSKAPIVGVIMGSKSDWEYMAAAAEVMEELQVPHEVRIMSAHRTTSPWNIRPRLRAADCA
jgi:phosphoribosylcarboxyaminoimidazole (NCAIR) mutase